MLALNKIVVLGRNDFLAVLTNEFKCVFHVQLKPFLQILMNVLLLKPDI